MNLYMLEIMYKNGWKKLVRSESRIFHDLCQMSKWVVIRKHKEFDSFIMWFESPYNFDSSHEGSRFKSTKSDLSQVG